MIMCVICQLPYPFTKQVSTILQTMVLASDDDLASEVSTKKQAQSFPPNFVHSIDSCHMMLTATACHREGITFAAVHDSFWTHACDVPRINVLLRERFIELHERPLLRELLASFRERYPSIDWDSEHFQPPREGDLDLRRVRDSEFFFS